MLVDDLAMPLDAQHAARELALRHVVVEQGGEIAESGPRGAFDPRDGWYRLRDELRLQRSRRQRGEQQQAAGGGAEHHCPRLDGGTMPFIRR